MLRYLAGFCVGMALSLIITGAALHQAKMGRWAPDQTLNSKEAYAYGQSDYFRTVFGNVGYVFAGGEPTALDAFELQYLPGTPDGRPKLCVVVRKQLLPDGKSVIEQDGNIYQC